MYFVFGVNIFSPMGTNTYFVKKSGNKPSPIPKEANDKKLGAVIQNNAVSLSYDATSGQITQITNKITSASVQGNTYHLRSILYFS